MTKEQYSTNLPTESQMNGSEDVLNTTLPARIGPYRSLSAKRPRDPSHRKSVSFNDVPIVHEVPSHDAMRNSNCDTYRSWTYTDATPPTSVVPSFYSSQIFSPFNSSNAAAQKLHANRLSNALYSSPSTTMTATTTTTVTPNRIPEWALRPKPTKTTSNADDLNTSSENNWHSPLIIVQAPDDKINKDTSVKSNTQSTYSSLHNFYSQQSPPAPTSSLASNAENGDERKVPYRSALVPDTEHHRSLPFTYGPLSDSTATYTSMLSTNLIQSNHSSNEQPTTGYTRAARARSATLPGTVNHSATRANDTVSITPFRATTAALLSNGSNASTRTILRPTTIAFQCSQPTTTTTTTNTITSSPATVTTTATNYYNATANLSSSSATTITNPTRPPPVPPRISSAAAHSRFVLPPHRTFSTASLASSALKYAFAHPTMESTLNSTMPSHTTIPKPPPTAYPRSRSANVLSTRRTAASPVVMLDGQSNGGTTINSNTNLYATAKRNPNVRQTYGSYYMHRVLLPTPIN